MTSSHLADKYAELIDKKLELAACLKKEHLLRMKLLQFDVAIKKQELVTAGCTDEAALLEGEDLML